MIQLPKTQCAIQLVGADKLVFNKQKPVIAPGPHQILCKVEAVGLCFSDLKLLKRFSSHVRKKPIVCGIEPEILEKIPSYVPADAPTVPGHEAVVRIQAVGAGVERFKPGQRYLVETDYRWLPTAGSNATFGYNFEGALQQYVLMDERIITSPAGQSMLIPADENISASAIALVEPWACVEHSYTAKQRRTIRTDGRTLIVARMPIPEAVLQSFFARFGRPGSITWFCENPPTMAEVPAVEAENLADLRDGWFDDVIYFGCSAQMLEALFCKAAAGGLINIVLCDGRFDKLVAAPVGRIHYSAIRIIGTAGFDPAEAMARIPETGEIRSGNKINIIGAGGPMGMMHVIRNICHPAGPAAVFAADIDENRLCYLSSIAEPLAKKFGVKYTQYNPARRQIANTLNYTALMAPVPQLIAQALSASADAAIINIFAGIAADVTAAIDMNAYIDKKIYFVGTSGSVPADMQAVLEKTRAGLLEPNITVAAVSGLAGAVDGIRAIENHSIPGKIVVYPSCRDLPLIRLDRLDEKLPTVAVHLGNGLWTKQAEQQLLLSCAGGT